MTCTLNTTDKRRLFWSTQVRSNNPDECGKLCGVVGLVPKPDGTQLSFSTDNWLTGLALNILLTDGRHAADNCGRPAGAMGGHWSNSFSPNVNVGFGSLIRQVPTSARIADILNLIKAYAVSDLNKLVTYGVASKISIVVKYLGNNRVSLNAKIYGRGGGVSYIGVQGTRLDNEWIWQT